MNYCLYSEWILSVVNVLIRISYQIDLGLNPRRMGKILGYTLKFVSRRRWNGKDLLINALNKLASSSDVIGDDVYSACCLRRFNKSKRCSSSNINSLFRSFKNDVFDERFIRFIDEKSRIAKGKRELGPRYWRYSFTYIAVVRWTNLTVWKWEDFSHLRHFHRKLN